MSDDYGEKRDRGKNSTEWKKVFEEKIKEYLKKSVRWRFFTIITHLHIFEKTINILVGFTVIFYIILHVRPMKN